jgi:thiamine-monophosphate kinase
MCGADRGVDEFEAIARLFRPLTEGAPEALGLADDAAAIPGRPGFDLIVSKDALVEGVHFLAADPLDLVARKLLRVNLSDLAAKGADPYAYLLAVAWPPGCGWPERELFARGLAEDQRRFGLKLLGGDTVSTPGPLTLSLTIFGWAPEGRMVKRAGARPGDRLLVSGTIGDGWLGLKAARGELRQDAAWLADRYRLPRPRLELIAALRAHASAAADVSDGLVADAGHIGEASGVRVELELDRVPLSDAATAWLGRQENRAAALAGLATGGDDYELVCAVPEREAAALMGEAAAAGVPLTDVGHFVAGEGIGVACSGVPVALARTGWRHG